MTKLTRQDFRLMHRLRVRWAEVDQQRIVFNPHYLMYIDTAFTEYWRALAVPYEAIPELLGGDVYVKKSSVEYHGSARLDDLLDVGLKCASVGNSSMIFHGCIFRGDLLLVAAELVYVFADPLKQTSKAVPTALRELLLSYEAGAALIDVQLCPWAEAATLAQALRREVFTDELKITLALDQDAGDTIAVTPWCVTVLGNCSRRVVCRRRPQMSRGLAGLPSPAQCVAPVLAAPPWMLCCSVPPSVAITGLC